MFNLFAVFVDREEFGCMFNHPYQLGILWWHLERSRARRCVVFHYIPSKPDFSGARAGKGERWLVKARGLCHVCDSNT